MNETIDVSQLIQPDGGQAKRSLLQSFRDLFTNHKLYEKKGSRYKEVLGNGDTLVNTGYFINKATLEVLTNSITSSEGGVWVNFAVGKYMGRANELQLVLTATETQDELDPTDLSTYCVTTAQLGLQVDPPYTGITSPKVA